MTYGYLNGYITNIGENIPSHVDELKKYAEEIYVDSLSSRIYLRELIDKLQPNDTIYVYSFLRFSSGLKDLVNLLDIIIDEKRANLVSLHDNFDSATERGKVAKDVYRSAIPLMNADPSYGFYR